MAELADTPVQYSLDKLDSFVGRLPPEILSEIFTCCAIDDSTAVATISAVSKKWRDVLYSAPRTWQYLTVDEYPLYKIRGSEFRRAKAELWLSKSHNLPFDFKFTYCNSDSVIAMLSYILPEVRRWREGIFYGPCASMVRFTLINDGEKPHIDQINIFVSNSDHHGPLMVDENVAHGQGDETELDDSNDWSAIAQATHRFDDTPGRLTSATVTVFRLPDPASLKVFHTLSRLNILNLDLDVEMTVHDIINFLTMCPALEILTLGNTPSHEPESPKICEGADVVSLPRLHTLRIISVHAIRCLLSHLITPCLENLYLLHINLAVQLPLLVGEDPGDSDDEAQDFSQSPWTDHATGMGLRLLYGKCKPPLRSLDMDYADLRTKDFRWAFDTFKDLTSLRIVASDMSNNVLYALRPSKNWLPLPSLTDLTLVQCQRASGHDIIEMIQARMNAAEKGLVAHITNFTVDRCVGFTMAHYLTLREIFEPTDGLTYILMT